jgi:hypothetical protein
MLNFAFEARTDIAEELAISLLKYHAIDRLLKFEKW